MKAREHSINPGQPIRGVLPVVHMPYTDGGAIDYATGTRDLKKMGGLKEKMPVTGVTSFMASMSISGLPPFNGFWSKLIIIVATVKAGHPVVAGVAIAMAFVTLAYYVKVQREILFGEIRGAVERAREVPAAMYVPLIILAIVCVGFGLLYPVFGQQILEPAKDALMNASEYIDLVKPVLG